MVLVVVVVVDMVAVGSVCTGAAMVGREALGFFGVGPAYAALLVSYAELTV